MEQSSGDKKRMAWHDWLYLRGIGEASGKHLKSLRDQFEKEYEAGKIADEGDEAL